MAGNEQKRRARASGGEAGAGFFPLVLITLTGTAVANYQLALLLAVGFLPTLALAFSDRSQWRMQKIQSVGSMNIAGLIPWIPQVWNNPASVEMLLTDVTTWTVIMSSVALGYALLFVGPLVASMILTAMSQEKLKTLNAERQTLIEAWGPEVLGEKDKVE